MREIGTFSFSIKLSRLEDLLPYLYPCFLKVGVLINFSVTHNSSIYHLTILVNLWLVVSMPFYILIEYTCRRLRFVLINGMSIYYVRIIREKLRWIIFIQLEQNLGVIISLWGTYSFSMGFTFVFIFVWCWISTWDYLLCNNKGFDFWLFSFCKVLDSELSWL